MNISRSSNSTSSSGSISNPGSSTTTGFLTALWLNGAVFAAEILIFSLLRNKFKAVYQPRTYLLPDSKRSLALPASLITWPYYLFKTPYEPLRTRAGLDAYFFVRFLRMIVIILLPIWLISWAVLLPLTSVNTGIPGNTGLAMFTFGNVGPSDQGRLGVHLLLCWIFTFWIFYNLKREMRHFLITRQLYLVDQAHRSTAQANTVLITGIPTKYLNEKALTDLFKHLPGGVKKVWLNRNLKELPSMYDQRLSACNVLEAAETALIKTALKIRRKQIKKYNKERKNQPGEAQLLPPQQLSATDTESSLSLAEKLVPAKKRPTHRLPLFGFMPFSLPLVGKKVDSIQWAREEIRKMSEGLESGRDVLRREAGAGAIGESVIGVHGGAFRAGGVAGLVMGVGGGVGGVVRKVPGMGIIVDREHKMREGAGFRDAIGNDKVGINDDGSDPRSGAHDHFGDKAEEIRISNVSPPPPQTALNQHQQQNQNENQNENHMNITNSPADDPNETPISTQTYPPLNSAFLLFNSQLSAHMASQILIHNEPYRMAEKHVEVSPADVIWSNLGLNPYEVRVRQVGGWSITIGLIVLWAFPVAFVGALSNVSKLCVQYSWLAWLCTIPKTVLGIIQGILPPVLLAVLMLLLPIILRLLVKMEGATRRTGVELSLMTRFFLFEVIHGFLIVTLSGGIIAALPNLLNDPTSIPSLLAQYLPSASNFFLTYVILQGLSGTASGFLQIASLVLYYVKLFILGSKPRSIYQFKYTMNNVKWGTLFPTTTLIVVITLGYSIISPIINGLACVTFFFFFQMYKYLFLYVYDQPASTETGGLFFPKAIQHVFVGLYVEQICLTALFFLARDENKKPSAVPEGALMIVLIVFTAFFHMILNNSYDNLLTNLPLTLADKAYTSPSPSIRQTPRSSRPMSPEMMLENAEEHDPPRFSDVNGTGKAPTYTDIDEHVHDHDYGTTQGYDMHTRPAADEEEHRNDNDVIRSGYRSPTSATYSNPNTSEEEEPSDFYHPAVVSPQRPIWIPRDEEFGLADAEVQACKEAGVRASCDNAKIDLKGKVLVGGEVPE